VSTPPAKNFNFPYRVAALLSKRICLLMLMLVIMRAYCFHFFRSYPRANIEMRSEVSFLWVRIGQSTNIICVLVLTAEYLRHIQIRCAQRKNGAPNRFRLIMFYSIELIKLSTNMPSLSRFGRILAEKCSKY
jgi:hypothetical protein